MKKFEDLIFFPHQLDADGKHAVLLFDNGYGVSVCRFKTGGRYGSYTSDESEWELAVVRKKAPNGFELCYDNEISGGDVLGHLEEGDVTAIMLQIQTLKKQDQ